jgi:hypothetical protein
MFLFVNYYLNVLAWTQNKKHFFRFSRRFSCLRQCRKVNNFDAAPALCKDFDAAPAPVPDKNFYAPVPGNNFIAAPHRLRLRPYYKTCQNFNLNTGFPSFATIYDLKS